MPLRINECVLHLYGLHLEYMISIWNTDPSELNSYVSFRFRCPHRSSSKNENGIKYEISLLQIHSILVHSRYKGMASFYPLNANMDPHDNPSFIGLASSLFTIGRGCSCESGDNSICNHIGEVFRVNGAQKWDHFECTKCRGREVISNHHPHSNFHSMDHLLNSFIPKSTNHGHLATLLQSEHVFRPHVSITFSSAERWM